VDVFVPKSQMTSQAAKFRRTQAWRRAAAAAVADARRKNLPCALCGGVVFYDAPPRTKWAPSVDHTRALSRGGEALHRDNLSVTHVRCNSRKGARPSLTSSSTSRLETRFVPPARRIPAEEWL